MEYKVSEKIQKKFDTLTKDAKVQKALQFMEDDQNEIIDRQIELTLIPAPTNHEQKKAARLLEMFKEERLPYRRVRQLRRHPKRYRWRKDGSCRGSYGHSISA